MLSKEKDATLVLLCADLPQIDILTAAVTPGTRSLRISSKEDALDQISAELSEQPTDRLVFVCHGKPGQLCIGSEPLDYTSLQKRRKSLGGWAVSKIDLYACNVAQDAAFIEALSSITSAFVAASHSLVGHQSLGGSWELTNGQSNDIPIDREVLDQWVEVLGDAPTPLFRATSANPGEAEAISLYLVNQMRHSPATWATLLDVDLDKDFRGYPVLDFLTGAAANIIPTDSIIYDDNLALAASAYAEVLTQYPFLDHELPGVGPADSANKTYPWTRAAYMGYLGGSVTENLANNLGTDAAVAALTNEQKARLLVEQLFIDGGVPDGGHRYNILMADHSEAGFGFATGPLQGGYRNYYTAQNFGTETSASSKPYLTGFVLANADGNLQYNQGEGLTGVTISITDQTDGSSYTTTTSTYGYWDFQATGGHSYTITASGGSYVGTGSASNVIIDVGGSNGYNSRSIDFFSGRANGRVDFGIPSNSSPTGGITISGDAVVGQTLTVNTTSLGDADGLGSLKYRWYVNGIELLDGFGLSSNPDASVNSSTLFLSGKLLGPNVVLATEGSASTLATGDWLVGKIFSVVVTYTDSKGTLEAVGSAKTAPVVNMTVQQALANLNNPAAREISISDTVANLLTLATDLTTLTSTQLNPYHKIRDFHATDNATISVADNTKLYQAIYKVKGWSDCFSENEFYTKYSPGKVNVSSTAENLEASLINPHLAALVFLPKKIELTGGSISASNLAYAITTFGASRLVRAPGATISVTGNFDALSTAERTSIISFLGDSTPPVLLSSSIVEGSKSLTLNFNEQLSGITAPANSFSVTVNGVSQQPTAVSVSGDKVILTLATAVALTDSITAAYTAPASGDRIKDLSDNAAAGISASTVSVVASPPIFQSASTNTAGDKVILTYSKPLSTTTAPISAFDVIPYDSGVQNIPLDRTVTSVLVNGNTIELTLNQPINNGRNPVYLWYDDPTTGNDANAIQEPTGVDAASLSSIKVTNNIPIATTWLGTTGNDSWTGTAGIDEAYANLGSDTLYGLAGNDILDLGYYASSTSTTALSDSSANTAYGGDGNDEIYGRNGADYISGDGGDDLIYASGGNDVLLGGDGNDDISGRGGNDTITGGPGNDLIDGGDNSDVAIFSLARSQYVITQSSSGTTTTVRAKQGTDGIDKVYNVETFRFADGDVSLANILQGNVNSLPTGTVTISGTPTQGQTLSASNSLTDADGLGAITYQWNADGGPITGATGSSLLLTQAHVGKAISVTARYTDIGGTLESVSSAATASVAKANSLPSGTVTISGTPTQGQTLTASNSLTDADGLGAITYQWNADDAAITGATGATLVLTQAHVGKAISVTASYTDNGGTLESVSSVATANVANVNDGPTGSVIISGTPTQGQTLTASNSLTDPDGLGTITYQWKAEGTAITGATGSTLLLNQVHIGKAISVTATYTDSQGTAEEVTSGSTSKVSAASPVLIRTITDNTGIVQGDITNGGFTDDTTLSLSGTLSAALETGDTVRVYDGATLLGTATVDSSGLGWSFTTAALAAGSHSFTARVADAAGNLSAAGTAYPVTIDTTAPTKSATGTAVSDNVGIIQGTVAKAGRTDDTSLSLSGTLSAALATGETIRIYDGTTYLGTASVTGTGLTWSYTDTRTLSNNQAVSYTARVADTAGNQSAAGTAYAVTVDTTAPATTAAVSAATDNLGLVQGAVSNGGVSDDTTLALNGTYSAALLTGETLRIFDGDTLLGAATVNTTARTWTFTTGVLAAGSHSFTARVVDAAGNLSAAGTPFVVTISTAPFFTSAETASFAENGSGTVYTAAASANAGGAISYGLSGADAGLFNLNASTGVLTFKNAPDFEAPADSGANNVYDVVITATEAGNTNTSSRNLAIAVNDATESDPAAYGILQEMATITPLEAMQGFYQDVSTLQLQSHSTRYLSATGGSDAKAATAIDTSNGALVGFGLYGAGRVAVVGSDDLVRAGLGADPAQGGIARGLFNLMSWLANDARSVNEQDTLHVLSIAGEGANAAIHASQSLFWEYLNDETSYTDETSSTIGDGQLAADYDASRAAARYSEALMPDGHWARNYDVVVLRADAQASEVQLVRQWMSTTGGGVLIDNDARFTPSAAVTALMADVGLSSHAGPNLTAGNYTPTEVDPTVADLVRSQLSGLSSFSAGTSAHPIYVSDDLKLPGEIIGGTVAWTSSAPTVIDNHGKLIGLGAATMTATVTFANGSTQTQAFEYRAFQAAAGTGLSLRIIDAASINAADTSIDAFLNSDLLTSATPLNSSVAQNVSWNQSIAYPSGATITTDALWLYTGFLVPQETGTYQLKITADDSAKFFLSGTGVDVSQGAVWWGEGTQSVNLVAGQQYKLWVFFKPSPGGGANNIDLSWMPPGGGTFTSIPASAFALPPEGLLSSSAGYPADWLPFGGSIPASSDTLSSTVIIDQDSLTTLYGNKAPLAAAQTFDFSEKNLYFDVENLVLTDAVAAQTQTLSIKLFDAAGSSKNIELVNYKLDGVTDGATLAAKVKTALNAANGSDASSAIDVSYDAALHTLRISDTEGRTVSNFILAKAADLTPTVLSGPPVLVQAGNEASGTASIAKIHFDGDALAATRLAISLDSSTDARDVALVDLAHWGLGFAGMDTFAQYLQDSIQARGETDVTVAWDDASKDLVFTDTLGRTFTNIELYTTSKYEPLVSYGDDASTVAGTTTATLGTLGGQVQATDINGDALTYTLLEATKFGTVTLDAASGKWSYIPKAGGDFHGWDQFTVSVSDGRGGVSAPIAISISNQAAPQVAMPVVRTFTVDDPAYVEPTATGNAVPSDFVFNDVFIAQTHVQRPDDPYLQLVGNRYALIKVNATSATGAAAPDMVATVTDSQGRLLGSLRLTGPAQLPTSVDLPSVTNLGSHSHANSYEAPLPSDWIQPGITIKVTAGSGDSAQTLSTFSPKVGADATLTVRNLGLSMFDTNQGAYITGLGSWGKEAVSKLPVQAFKLYEYPLIKMDSYGKEQAGNWGVWTGITNNLPGTDPVFGGGFQSDISFAIHLAGSLKAANFVGSGSGSTMAYVGFSPGAGGGLGGGSIGGGDASAGILWHEFAGHGQGRGHAATDSDYPYNTITIEGLQQGGWLGPNWGYDQGTGTYLPNYTINADGTLSLQTDPMAGGAGQQPAGYVFQQFSDYYNLGNYEYIAGQTQWVSDPSQNAMDGSFAGDGYFKSWDATAKDWVVWTQDNYASLAGYWRQPEADLPHKADQNVYWLTMNIVDQHGAAAKPGVTYADNLKVLPVQTVGDLSEPFRDILTGEGRALDSNSRDGDYVMRITYATTSGLITDNLIIPANYSLLYAGFNVADKGELVRVDIVEAENASVSAYLENKVVASYVNSNALANTVFKGDPCFNADDASLVLPQYWNGGKVTWSTTEPGLVNLQTGAIDSSKLNAGSALRAQWVEDGQLRIQTFVLKLPDTVQTMHQLFGDVTAEAHPDGVQVISGDRALPTTLAGATVSWSSSDATVIDAQGHLLKTGAATLTATVTWANGAVQQFSEHLYAQPPVSFTQRTPYVTRQLFGAASEQDSVPQKGYLLHDLTLPTTVDNGTVSWTTSNPSVINSQGQLVGAGAATLTATVTFADGLVQTYSKDFYAVKGSELATGGLLQRIVDIRDYQINGVDPADTNIKAFLTPEVLNRTPLVNQVTATLDWSKPDGAGANHASYPAAAKDASGYLIESLWSYSGFVKATTAGTYQFKLIADDSAAIYVQHGDQLVSETTTWQDRAGGGKVISVDLAAGETAPIWVFFKPQAGDSYWGDEVHLTWKTPDDAAFAAIPADQLVATPSSLVSASTGFAQAYLPFASTDTTSTNGLGLQLRVLDTSSYLYSGAATGLDRYLTAELLGQTPIYSGTATPDLDVKPVGGNSGEGVPSAILNASGQVKDSLWVYSGYLLPKVSGSYTFSFDADDDGRVDIGSGAQTTSVSSWVNDGDPKTVAVDLQAGEVVPLWVFFKNQAPGGYWGDWVNLKWKLPGDADFTAIPVEQMAPMSDALVHPNAGYPASRLPFDFDAGSASALVGSTQIAGTPTFSALGAQPSTQLTQDWNIAAQSDDISVVSGSHFERSFSVPTEWAGGNMQHWLNLVVRQVDGTLSEITPLESWEFTTATTAAGTSLSIKGTVDSTPSVDVVGFRIYSDDNLLDATAPAILNIPLNQALQAPAFSSDGSLSIYGSSGNDVLDAEHYSITGGTGSSASDANPNTVHGGDGNDKIYGSNTGADILKGDAGDDFILGRGGDDTIYGGSGNDFLTGNSGANNYVFDTPLSATTNVDTIDNSGSDSIRLDKSIFSTLAAGTLSASRFYRGASAQNSEQHVICNPATGYLSYDCDGNGDSEPIAFAKLLGTTTITESYFIVI